MLVLSNLKGEAFLTSPYPSEDICKTTLIFKNMLIKIHLSQKFQFYK